jgi:alpha-1,6-mannosyltransferase
MAGDVPVYTASVLQWVYAMSTNTVGLSATVVQQDPASATPHLVDATMFWSATGGGVGRYLRDKRRWAVTRAGWRHTWVVTGACEPPGKSIGGMPIPFSGGYRLPLRRRHAARLLAGLDPDVIEAGDPFRLAWAAIDAAQQRGIPVTTFCHSNVAAEAGRWLGPPARATMRRYLRHLLVNFDAVFAASRWMVDELRDLGLDNVVHQPLGVDLSRFSAASRCAHWRERLGIPADSCVLIYAGRFAREKNLQVLADTVDRLGSGYVLVAHGAGPYPPRGDRVRVLQYASDPGAVATALASADVFVHAGTRETFGLAPLEALACGTPVVLPAQAGFLDLIDGKAAIGVAAGTADALAEAVRELRTQDPESLRQQACAAALAFDEQRSFANLFARYAALRCASPRRGESIGGLRLA